MASTSGVAGMTTLEVFRLFRYDIFNNAASSSEYGAPNSGMISK
jgi:hypothetical protein